MSKVNNPIIGTYMDGGFYSGRILIDGAPFGLIVAPKDDGEYKPVKLVSGINGVPRAKSYNDGHANTRALADAASQQAIWALSLRLGGNDDWYIPAMDELEIIYRNLKTTTEKNFCGGLSGINLSAIEPTRPYTRDFPVQTLATDFQYGGEQAFEVGSSWYWSSTQHAADPECTWYQDFNCGNQSYFGFGILPKTRAIRRFAI